MSGNVYRRTRVFETPIRVPLSPVPYLLLDPEQNRRCIPQHASAPHDAFSFKWILLARPEEQWMRRDAPELRIVDDALWTAAHRRLEDARASYLWSTNGKLNGRAP